MVPRIAILSQNTLEAMGLKSIISDIIPKVDVSVFSSLDDLKAEAQATPFFHYFVSSQMLLANADFFRHARRSMTWSGVVIPYFSQTSLGPIVS